VTRAGKNVINILAWCSILETHPDKLHLAAGVSNATAKLNIVDSNGFGLLNYFKGRCRQGKYQDKDAVFLQTETGEKIVLIAGGGREGDERLIKGWTLGTAYITEVNECCKTFVKEVFDRTLSSQNRKLFFDLNPKSPNHWFYTDILDFHQKNAEKYPDYGLNYGHFTLFDNLSFNDEKIRETLRTYKKNTVWYLRDILGKRTNAEGIIYDMWDEDANSYDDSTRPPGLERLCRRYIPVDYGTQNPMGFLDCYDDGVTIWIDAEYYYSGRAEMTQKTDAQYADDFLEFVGTQPLGDTSETVQRDLAFAIIDPSAASFKAELRQRGIRVRDADNTVLDGIRMTATMIKKRRIRVHKRCTHFRNEIRSYIWDEKKSKTGEDQPLKEFDHLMDAIRYLIKTIITARRLAA
jgi:PBSX family phage terminase large subunit